jgi:hypothetical protein
MVRAMAELDIRLPETMRRAELADWDAIGAITADAFQNDPVSRWIFGNKRAMRPVFGRQARHIYLPRGVCQLAGDDGATMWLLPGAKKDMSLLGTLDIGFHMTRLAGLGAIRRGMAADAENDPAQAENAACLSLHNCGAVFRAGAGAWPRSVGTDAGRMRPRRSPSLSGEFKPAQSQFLRGAGL